jgi:hypothetical protein
MTQTALESIRGVLTQIAPLPTGIDAARLALWAARGKFSYEQIRGILGAAMQALNEERVMAWGDWITLTPDMKVEYMNGGAVQPAEITMGKSRVPLVVGNNAGHMIDLKVWAQGVGGDGRTFEDMSESQLIGSVVGCVTSLRDAFDQALINRAFDPTDNPLGSTGYDVSWCNASPLAASGGPKYAPPKHNGKVFYEDHNHFLAVNSAATNPATSAAYTYGDGLSLVAALVGEHGLPMATYFKVYVSEADVDVIQLQSRYVLPVDNINVDKGGLATGNIYYENGVVGATPNSGGRYVGSVNTSYGFGRLFSIPRIPTGYANLYRPGTPFAANNALAIRYRPSVGFGPRLNEIPDFNTTFPIKEIDVEDEYGISCGTNRFAAASMEFGSGVTTYAKPTIS